MKLERAIDILENFTGYQVIYQSDREDDVPSVDEMLEAVRMAIDALKKEIEDETI